MYLIKPSLVARETVGLPLKRVGRITRSCGSLVTLVCSKVASAITPRLCWTGSGPRNTIVKDVLPSAEMHLVVALKNTSGHWPNEHRSDPRDPRSGQVFLYLPVPHRLRDSPCRGDFALFQGPAPSANIVEKYVLLKSVLHVDDVMKKTVDRRSE